MVYSTRISRGRDVGRWVCLAFGMLLGVRGWAQVDATKAGSRSGWLDATKYPGADIMGQVQAAFGACSGKCVVEIPPGTYVATTTLSLPLWNLRSYDLVLDAGAYIDFRGKGWWLDTYEVQPNPAGAGLRIEGSGTVAGNPESPGAIRLLPTNDIEIRGVTLRNFLHGDLIQIQGTEHVNIHNTTLVNATFGVHLLGTNCRNGPPFNCSPSLVVSPGDCAANSICGYAGNMVHLDQNAFSFFSGAAFLEDSGSEHAVYEHLSDTFTNNEVNGGGTGVWAKFSRSPVISGNYFEAQSAHFLILGGGGYGVTGGVVLGNYFTSSLPFSIEVNQAVDTLIEGNSEGGPPSTCMVNLVRASRVLYQANHVEGANAVCVNGAAHPVFTRQKAPMTSVLDTGPAGSRVVIP